MATATTNQPKPIIPQLPHLLVTEGPQRGLSIKLDFKRLQEKPLTIGRTAVNEVALQSQQNFISSRHAAISYRAEDKLIILTDVGSTNGTRLNGDFVASPLPLYPGDRIGLGDVELVFLLPNMPPPPQPPRYAIDDKTPGLARLDVVGSKAVGIRLGAFCRLTPAHPFVIGRHSASDLRLMEEGEEGRLVSRRQCEIRWDNGGYIIYNPGALNPTWVNHVPLVSPRRLEEGDIIQIASTALRYRAPRVPIVPGQPPTPEKKSGLVLRFASRWALHLGPQRIMLPTDKEVIIGRDKATNMRLLDGSVSRRHAIITFQNNRYIVDDAGSINGTKVNGKKIVNPVALRAGDRITFGEFDFVLEEAGSEMAVPLNAPISMQLALDTAEAVEALRPSLPGDGTIMGYPLPSAPVYPEVEYKGTFEEVCNTLGKPITAGGNQPFLLDDPESIWLVQEGRVEVFAVQVKQGQPTNARHHVLTALAGNALLGMDSAQFGEGLGLLAAPTAGTKLLKIPAYHFPRMAANSEYATPIAALVEEWVEGLAQNITGEVENRNDILLEAGEELKLEAMQKAAPKKSGLWLRLSEGASLYLGEEEMPPPSDRTLFPLYPNGWLLALDECRVKAYEVESVIAEAGLWEGLKAFYEIFFRVKFTNIRLTTFDEINRLRKKAEYDTSVGQEALASLAAIVKRGEITASESGLTKNYLLLACRLVGDAMGIAVQGQPETEAAQESLNPLGEIARASRMRIREIEFETNWWTKEGGPLLGFIAEEEEEEPKPVALLPVSEKAYELVNPADGTRQRVTKAVAAKLNPRGYVFYRPFPQKALGAWDLVKFGARNTRREVLIILLLSVGGGLLALFTPAITAYLFDTVVPGGNKSLLLQVALGLVVVAISTATFQITRGIAIMRMETRIDSSTQAALWDRLLDLPTSFFRKFSVGDLAVRAMGIDAIQQLIGSSVITALLGSVFSVFSFFLLFSYDVGLALVALLLTAVTLAVIAGSSLWELRYQRNLSERQGRVSGLVLQLINGISKLRVAGAETRAFGVWAREFAAQRKTAYRARTIGNYLEVFNAAWPVVTSIIIFAAVDAFKKGQNLSTGTFLAFIAAYGQFLGAVLAMAAAFTAVLQAIPIYERLKIILETLPEARSGTVDPGELNGAIELNHVSFRYNPDTPLILSDVSMHIKPGQFVAIVGASGSGKSTLLRLLLGFETPESGSIYYDNQDLGELDVQAVRRRIGVVMQNGKLMPGDIMSNIVGSAPYTLEDAWEAAKMAGLDEDIRQMPMNMFTLIAEGGSTLSGGQKQRLMIARAIIGKPRILLFDEATSALDNQTQAIVSHSLENLKATRIVIAHRLSTIVKADAIFVMAGGRLVQSGTYAELMSVEGPFKDLADRQLA